MTPLMSNEKNGWRPPRVVMFRLSGVAWVKSVVPPIVGATPNELPAVHWNHGVYFASSSWARTYERRARAAQSAGLLRSAKARHSSSEYVRGLMVAGGGVYWPKPSSSFES